MPRKPTGNPPGRPRKDGRPAGSGPAPPSATPHPPAPRPVLTILPPPSAPPPLPSTPREDPPQDATDSAILADVSAGVPPWMAAKKQGVSATEWRAWRRDGARSTFLLAVDTAEAEFSASVERTAAAGALRDPRLASSLLKRRFGEDVPREVEAKPEPTDLLQRMELRLAELVQIRMAATRNRSYVSAAQLLDQEFAILDKLQAARAAAEEEARLRGARESGDMTMVLERMCELIAAAPEPMLARFRDAMAARAGKTA